uniref:Uncharacterized protein n=1 Tax=Salix viminalis TaxID=40686 RepID=A0A6N2K7I6_SALVM
MYVLRDTAKGTSGKDKSTYLQVPKRDDQQLLNAVTLGSGSGTAVLEDESGVSGITDFKRKSASEGRRNLTGEPSISLVLPL